NTLSDGSRFADTFLRNKAAIRAAREFRMMHAAAKDIVKKQHELGPITQMIEEAQRSAIEETDMSLAKQANLTAERAYKHIKVRVGPYYFTHQVTQLNKIGANFKRADIAPGVHFNDLNPSPYKEAIAKAMIVTQLSLRLAGVNTDLDRHGGNIKIQGTTIAHFDFGAMNLAPLTEEDKTVTGWVIAETLNAVVNGEPFAKALLTQIQRAKASEATRSYLNGLNKDFLALGDYVDAIKPNELASIIAQCLTSERIDLQINAAFREHFTGIRGLFIIKGLKWKALSSPIHIRLQPDNEFQQDKLKMNKLGQALEERDYQALYALLEAQNWDINASLTAEGAYFLESACSKDIPEVTALFLNMGANPHQKREQSDTTPNQEQIAAFMKAAQEGNAIEIKKMLSEGFAYSETHCFGALEAAVQSDSFEVVALLVEQGTQLTDERVHAHFKNNAQKPQLELISTLFELERAKQKGIMDAFIRNKDNSDASTHAIDAIKNEFKIKAHKLRAEHAIRWPHQYNLPLITAPEIVPAELATVLKSIRELEDYGQKLKNKGKAKGDKAIHLAKNLRSEVCSYANNTLNKEEATYRIHAFMQQGRLVMREDRTLLDILAHIAFALTGYGLYKMRENKQKTGTFFLTPTKRERLLDDVDKEIQTQFKPEDS
ncbi:MAG: hypothetical protein ACHP6H_05720, partial [Legionellales bacterium]